MNTTVVEARSPLATIVGIVDALLVPKLLGFLQVHLSRQDLTQGQAFDRLSPARALGKVPVTGVPFAWSPLSPAATTSAARSYLRRP